jgi:hypothetical protein
LSSWTLVAMSGSPVESAAANGTKSSYPLIELPKGDLNDYYYYRQVWMGMIHVTYIGCIIG